MADKYKQYKNLPGPESIRRFEFRNGITLLVYNNSDTRSVYAVGLMACGSTNDPSDKLGLAHFTATMLTRGTKKRDFPAYHQILEDRGANLSFSCGARYTWFRGKSLAEDIEMLVDLAADSLMNPSFHAIYIERLRKQLIAGLAIRDQDATDTSSMLFDSLLFPDHPYGNPVDGSIESVSAITRDDIEKFQSGFYKPQGTVIAVTGAVDPESIRGMVEKYFSGWDGVSREISNYPPIPDPPKQIIRQHIPLEDKSQANLVMGTFGPRRTAEEYLSAYLGNNILGQFGLMGRIGERVRSRSGLAYYASSSLSGWSDGGAWEFSAGTNPDNLDKTIGLIRDEIKRFIDSLVTDTELEDSRSHLIGRLPLSLESNAGLANAILTIERFNLGLDYYQRYTELLQAITASQILDTARKYLHPDRLVIASAGASGKVEGK